MKFTIKESSLDIAERINYALARSIENAASQIRPNLGDQLQPLLINKWKKSATYASLIYGDLNGKIGFPAGTAKDSVDNILEEAAKSVQISYRGTRVNKRKFVTKIDVFILKQDLHGVLNSIYGLIQTEKNELLYWTDWLLVQGDRIVVDDWRYFRRNGKGRSGMGIMVKNGSFRIPSIHSGVLGDNWLTRVIESFVVEISRASKIIIEQEIKRYL
jgi:hypothetical protein